MPEITRYFAIASCALTTQVFLKYLKIRPTLKIEGNHSSRMPTTRLSTVSISVAAIMCQNWWKGVGITSEQV